MAEQTRWANSSRISYGFMVMVTIAEMSFNFQNLFSLVIEFKFCLVLW